MAGILQAQMGSLKKRARTDRGKQKIPQSQNSWVVRLPSCYIAIFSQIAKLRTLDVKFCTRQDLPLSCQVCKAYEPSLRLRDMTCPELHFPAAPRCQQHIEMMMVHWLLFAKHMVRVCCLSLTHSELQNSLHTIELSFLSHRIESKISHREWGHRKTHLSFPWIHSRE